ncbi:MAG TPA: Hsp20/alpha crystallin family protein [Candidatus Acidoferrum sp.]|nr:Hsp20/alpha crystallin family protein [Candidatus Acidoferrum sp.]
MKVNSSLYSWSIGTKSGDKSAASHWVPNTDVYVTEDTLVIKVELAGMRKEDLELTVEGNQLTITGHRPDGCRAPKCKFLVMEINYGSFQSVIELPPGYDLSLAKAAYQNGFLRIDVPQAAAAEKKHLSLFNKQK